VEGLTQRGISTSAFGLGSSFDEDLMGAIAMAGDGTLAHIESPEQLTDLYASELKGLLSNFGYRVSIAIEEQNGSRLLDIFNDLPQTTNGTYRLSNLRYGQQLTIGVRSQLPPWNDHQEIMRVRLTWDSQEEQNRQELNQSLTLPVKEQKEINSMDRDEEVAEQLILLLSNRERRRAIAYLDSGDVQSAAASLDITDSRLSAMPQSPSILRERQLLADKKRLLRLNRNLSRKHMYYESLRSSVNVYEVDRDDH